jgi:hypothetical protein
MVPSTGRTYTTDAQSERASLHRGVSMNKTFASLTAAAVVAFATSLAAAQASAFVLEPGVHTTFQRHVATANIAPVRVDAHLVAGGVVPAGIALHSVPHAVVVAAPELRAHRFVVSDDRIHVVHPTTRAVVGVINR